MQVLSTNSSATLPIQTLHLMSTWTSLHVVNVFTVCSWSLFNNINIYLQVCHHFISSVPVWRVFEPHQGVGRGPATSGPTCPSGPGRWAAGFWWEQRPASGWQSEAESRPSPEPGPALCGCSPHSQIPAQIQTRAQNELWYLKNCKKEIKLTKAKYLQNTITC